MIPRMDVYGGWGGFLGLRLPASPDSLTLAQLRQASLRLPVTWAVNHAEFLRNAAGANLGPLLVRQGQSQPLKGTVALIGAGIANLIAAYELSRCGVAVTMFERRPQQEDVPHPFGGRLRTETLAGYPTEQGPKAFPSCSPLLWHYVWRVAVANGYT